MTLFISLRAIPSGGFCADLATFLDDTNRLLPDSEFSNQVRGRHVLLAAHGFNVGQEPGMASLKKWDSLCRLPPGHLFVGVLWPGDSRFLPVIDYPVEGEIALKGGRVLADYLNRYGTEAASISFASHSLGARTMLEALRNLNRKARRVMLMAGAIEDDCLTNEYADAAGNVEKIHIVASREDYVLQGAFPIGNLVGEIIMRGHPYFQRALGIAGPAQPIDLAQQGAAWQIPNEWDYGHLDYLPGDQVAPPYAPPLPLPQPGDGAPTGSSVNGWKSSWSAAVLATQVA